MAVRATVMKWIVCTPDGREAHVTAEKMFVTDSGSLVLSPVAAFAPRTWIFCHQEDAQIVWTGEAPTPALPPGKSTRTPGFAGSDK
jgi:hypothetical protein